MYLVELLEISNHKNIERIRQDLTDQNWERVLQSGNPDEAYNNFVDILTMIMNHICPFKKTRNNFNHKTKPFYDKEATDLKINFLKARRCKRHGLEYLSTMRRTASLDAIYLMGQWPRDMYSGLLQVDKATQTDETMGDPRKAHRYTESSANEDKLEKYIRHR
ncbi:hypothetical protein J6590_070552 [Homalodisca vitripennis]|nr:hypothetical protein J6590_070552 [Homalodisca vitripennis]